MNIPVISNKNSNTLQESYNKKHYPEFYQMIIDKYKDFDISFKEKLYWYFHNIQDYPICPVCGKHVKFESYGVGYKQYCSSSCISKDPQIKQKREETCLKRYGVNNPSKSSKILQKIQDVNMELYGVPYHSQLESAKEQTKKTCKELYGGNAPMSSKKVQQKRKDTLRQKYGDENYNNREKCKQTCQEKYGVDNVQKSKKIHEKVKQTTLEKYGVEYCTQSQEVVDKIKQTNLEKYGVESYSQTNEFKEKNKQTNLKRYGVTCSLRSQQALEKTQQTLLDRYGVNHYSKSQEFKNQMKEANSYTMKNRLPELLEVIYQDDEIWYKIECPNKECHKCNEKFFLIPPMIYYNRLRNHTETCTNLVSIGGHNSGTTLELFVRNILDTYNIHYIENDRKILKGKELDIYIPGHKLAIECNGIYWHSVQHKNINNIYHFNKWKECKDQDIQLLTIWEDQIINKPEIIEGIIKSHLGIYEHQVGARKCILKEVSSKESNKFLEKNHLQGKINGSIRLGLYYQDELISLMIFGTKRVALGNKGNKDAYELYRYCNKLGWQIQGGASRLFKHFLDSYPESVIESFSSNDISIGDLYKKLKFELIDIQKGSYWYIDKQMNRHHRYSFRKDVLVKEGYDPNKTESEITEELGLLKIYDSGQQKWIYKNH